MGNVVDSDMHMGCGLGLLLIMIGCLIEGIISACKGYWGDAAIFFIIVGVGIIIALLFVEKGKE